jgi:hypothetical protein
VIALNGFRPYSGSTVYLVHKEEPSVTLEEL